ncbi:glucuronate isomerase [Chryseolinea lacunae]|uniref:Uronate isomerase n=1 Tax=Chryseolinea lacunae TaxID=2801331 RepID=A0ABS1KYV2_9BACT|nr:glucuronate isomerase [Chryseolinea lacunae]MBL0744515.1 glucuronate isomerase [Chryseolinea lacunae]
MIKTSKTFLGDDFLLETDVARYLYEQHAATKPIIDYHNHLSPKDIAENRRFNNLTEIWLEGDHYKWRGMRTNGVAERYCTGNAAPFEKFMKWAETVPYTLRNPLFHWTHLELKNYFGITTLLDESSAHEIYETCTALLQQEDYSVQSLLTKMNVEVLCTTDDPIDSLEYHRQFASQRAGFRMFPTFRPDKSFGVENAVAYKKYIEQLAVAAGTSIVNFDDLLQALKNRVDYFHQLGCRVSDHGLEHLYFHERGEQEAPALFTKVMSGKTLDANEVLLFKSAVLVNLGKIYHSKGWVQQFHLGAMRNNNSRMLRELGPDTGFDSIGEYAQGKPMTRFFDHLDNTNQLAKTILYNLNPADNELFATMTGNFNDGTVPGKMQFGSGWWFLDQKDGMERQMNTLSNMGLLSRFVGMVTDSRSFLSFPRHEYFRRILCNLVGNDVEKGELPDDMRHLSRLISDISYGNAKQYFNF